MSRRGNCWDNAPMERYFEKFKVVNGFHIIGYGSFEDAERMISQYITGYFNPYRTHQHNGGLPPNKAEENYWLTSKIVVKNT